MRRLDESQKKQILKLISELPVEPKPTATFPNGKLRLEGTGDPVAVKTSLRKRLAESGYRITSSDLALEGQRYLIGLRIERDGAR